MHPIKMNKPPIALPTCNPHQLPTPKTQLEAAHMSGSSVAQSQIIACISLCDSGSEALLENCLLCLQFVSLWGQLLR